MNTKIFNGCLLGGWFLLTLGGIILNPGAGLLIGGLALIVLTLTVSARFGLYDGSAPKGEEANKTSVS